MLGDGSPLTGFEKNEFGKVGEVPSKSMPGGDYLSAPQWVTWHLAFFLVWKVGSDLTDSLLPELPAIHKSGIIRKTENRSKKVK